MGTATEEAMEQDSENIIAKTVSAKLQAAIKAKASFEEVVEVLKEIPDEDTELHTNPLRISVFVQSLMELGSKSFSHSFAAIAKFHPTFKVLSETEEAQVVILRSLFELWKTHQQMMVVLVDKMLKTQIVECSAVANWIFSKEMVSEFTKGYTWEMLHLTIRKMNKHVNKLSKEASEARRMIDESDSDNSENDSANEMDEKEKRSGRKTGNGNGSEKPTEEHVERLEEKLEAAQADQKNLFLIIFQRFIMILSEHLVHCDTDGMDFKTPWYMWTVGRLQQVFMMHHEQVEKYSTTLETL